MMFDPAMMFVLRPNDVSLREVEGWQETLATYQVDSIDMLSSVLSYPPGGGGASRQVTSFVVNDSQKWYLEPIAYRRGDANVNSTLTNDDTSLATQFSVGTAIPNNAQRILCDMDNDEQITMSDVRLIDRLVSGLD